MPLVAAIVYPVGACLVLSRQLGGDARDELMTNNVVIVRTWKHLHQSAAVAAASRPVLMIDDVQRLRL